MSPSRSRAGRGLRPQLAAPAVHRSSPALRATRWTSRPEGLLHLKLLRSPHAHARIPRFDKDEALALPGVVAVYIYEDAPRSFTPPPRTKIIIVDPDDTSARPRRALRRPARRGGRRRKRGRGGDACRLLEVEYEFLPAVFDPEAAMEPGAPVLHDKGAASALGAGANIFAEIHGEIGDVAAGFAEADASTKARTSPSGCSTCIWRPIGPSPGWTPTDGSTCAPARKRRSTRRRAVPLRADPGNVRVFTERVGGGFGGKQEMLTEDSSRSRPSRPAGRSSGNLRAKSNSSAATTRHPMRVASSRARRDGTLTAIELRVVSNTGAYGNHAGAVLPRRRPRSRSIAAPTRRSTAMPSTRTWCRAAVFAATARRRPASPSSRAIDELAARSTSIRSSFARNIVNPGDAMISTGATKATTSNTAATASTNASTLVEDAIDGGSRPPASATTGWSAAAWRPA